MAMLAHSLALLVLLLLLHAPARAVAGHCGAAHATCGACLADDRCQFCTENGRCQMANEGCGTSPLLGAESATACPGYEKGSGPPFFQDASAKLVGNPAQLNYGVAITDFDGDGAFEALVAGYGARNAVYKHMPDGTYRDVIASCEGVAEAKAKRRSHCYNYGDCGACVADARCQYCGNGCQMSGDTCSAAPVPSPESCPGAPAPACDHDVVADSYRKAIGVAACDVDGDGREELYVLNTDAYGGVTATSDRLFQRDPSTGQWRDMFTLPKHSAAANFVAGRSCACVDRDGDGRYGVFVANYAAEPMRLFETNNATGALFDAAPEAGIATLGGTGGRAVVAGPITGGPRMDVLANNEWSRYSGSRQGANFLLTNLGDGTFANEAAARGIEDRQENGRGTALFDANHDGRVDVVYGNWNGVHRLMLQQEDGAFRDVAAGDMAEPTRIRTVIAADFDNDGKTELFWNNIPGENKLFQEASVGSDGTQWVKMDIGAALEVDGYGTGAAIADFDNDGILELLVSHGESREQPLSLYKATAAAVGNHYLRVLPKTRFGAPARGASVSLVANGIAHYRYIDAGSGYLCQMEPVAHFGLGAAVPSGNLTVTVTWPDGATFTGALAADEMHIVKYPGNAPASLGVKTPRMQAKSSSSRALPTLALASVATATAARAWL